MNHAYHVRYAPMALPLVFTSLFFLHSILNPTRSDAHTAAEAAEGAPDSSETDAVLDLNLETLLQQPHRLPALPPEQLDSETLWLARCIFSETKRPHEQELIAWVVRNRVETAYRGKTTYREVVLDPYQFSAFNPGSPKRAFYTSLGLTSSMPGWQRALSIAHHVRHAPDSLRPFPLETRHFYSERSMPEQTSPVWAAGLHPVAPARLHPVDTRRFRFFADVT
ncbi:hypothetical protein AWN76_010275 [Rhodothermaceae bacterium RA]|nr:hypothetical protein AWN76_010275 [Rhodothermaceae bacterium RA]